MIKQILFKKLNLDRYKIDKYKNIINLGYINQIKIIKNIFESWYLFRKEKKYSLTFHLRGIHQQ